VVADGVAAESAGLDDAADVTILGVVR